MAKQTQCLLCHLHQRELNDDLINLRWEKREMRRIAVVLQSFSDVGGKAAAAPCVWLEGWGEGLRKLPRNPGNLDLFNFRISGKPGNLDYTTRGWPPRLPLPLAIKVKCFRIWNAITAIIVVRLSSKLPNNSNDNRWWKNNSARKFSIDSLQLWCKQSLGHPQSSIMQHFIYLRSTRPDRTPEKVSGRSWIIVSCSDRSMARMQDFFIIVRKTNDR